MSESNMLASALVYSSWGWPVFPVHSPINGVCSCGNPSCNSPAKHPITRRGVNDATTDEGVIRDWWTRYPRANIGFALPEDIVVVDVDDQPHIGKFGADTLAEIVRDYNLDIDTVAALTGGGGLHIYYRTRRRLLNNNTRFKHVDVKTQGGYVLLPPSLHMSGKTYDWEASSRPGEVSMLELPDALQELLARPHKKETDGLGSDGSDAHGDIREGERNNLMFRLASSLRARGLSQDSIIAAMLIENEKRCVPPLTEEEVRTLAKSAGRYEQGQIYDDALTVEPGDYSDVGNAQVFARIYAGLAIYVRSIGWLIWNGKLWQDDELRARELAINLTDRMLDEANNRIGTAGEAIAAAAVSSDSLSEQKGEEEKRRAEYYRKHAKASRAASRIKGMLELAQALLQVSPIELDRDAYLLNTPAGMVDLRTGVIRPHDPTEFCTKITRYSPSASGTEMWRDFINTVTCDRADLATFLQRVAGMAAIGSVFEENLIVALGDGKNGKSVCFNTLAYVMGEYSGTLAAEVLTTANKSKGAEMATLKGKRLVIAAETEEGARLAPGVVKQIASTDKIHAERKYKDPEDFAPSHTLVLYTNHLPRVGSTDSGIWRRLVVVPFMAKIDATQEVKNYSAVLARKAGGAILTWIIDGARQFTASDHKLALPEPITDAILRYKEENDWMGHFLDDCCEMAGGYFAPSAQLLDTYKAWCERAGEYRRGRLDFYQELEKRGFRSKKTEFGSRWIGVKIKQIYNSYG